MMYPKGFPYSRFFLSDFQSILSEKTRGSVLTVKGRIPGGDLIVADFKISPSFPRSEWFAFSVRFNESETHKAIERLDALYRVAKQ